MKKFNVGYTAGVFDLFHVGHLNILRTARSMCDRLIVGVTVDELVSYKGKTCVIPFEERIDIVRSIDYVDAVVPQIDIDKYKAWERIKFDTIFVGDDWYGTTSWKNLEKQLSPHGVDVIYLPYTRHTSSTKLTGFIDKYCDENREQ